MSSTRPNQEVPNSEHLFAKLAGAKRSDAPSAAGCGCPVVQEESLASAGSGCPVASTSQSAVDPKNMMPAVPNNALSGQKTTNLATERQRSTIPTTGDTLPKHQQEGSNVWVYPSEQMFFNAMKRKGWEPHEEDMHAVVAIHNTVNERAWREVLAYESLHSTTCPLPKLKRFMGRPADYSPKARLLNFLGFKLPFDRHDWIVDRCGQEVRYVIDFYNAPSKDPSKPVGVFLDVRPALDSVTAVLDRVRMQMHWISSGRWRE